MSDDGVCLRNPLHCSGLTLDSALSMESLGIAVANDTKVTFAAAHLYNALQILQILETAWPEMNRFLEMHKRAIFAEDIPVTLEAMEHRMLFRLRSRKEAWKLSPHRASSSLKLILEEEDIEIPLRPLETIIAEREAGPRRAGDRPLTPVQLLAGFEKHLPELLEDIKSDYSTLVRHCTSMVRAFYIAMETGRDRESLEDEYDMAAEGPTFAVFVYEILSQARKFRVDGEVHIGLAMAREYSMTHFVRF